jgi:hypothetical protein
LQGKNYGSYPWRSGEACHAPRSFLEAKSQHARCSKTGFPSAINDQFLIWINVDFAVWCSISIPTMEGAEPMKKLSEQLADLSVRARNGENAVAAAQKEAQEKITVLREKAHAAAAAAVERVNQDLKSTGDNVARDWNVVKAKVASDVNALKANVAQAKHELDVKHAGMRADRLEWEANFAIDYAAAAIEQATMATLDAIGARAAAEKAKRAA